MFNHELINITRFISYESVRLCNLLFFSTVFNAPCIYLKTRCNGYYSKIFGNPPMRVLSEQVSSTHLLSSLKWARRPQPGEWTLGAPAPPYAPCLITATCPRSASDGCYQAEQLGQVQQFRQLMFFYHTKTTKQTSRTIV